MKTLGIVIVIVVLLGLGWYFYSSQYSSPETLQQQAPASSAPLPEASLPAAAPSAAPSVSQGEAPSGPEETVVEMTASGFSPSSLTLKVGDMVRFMNKDTKNHWPASAVHPTHQCYPGFDALEAVAPGASYVFTFNVAKTCAFHDHLNPSLRGSITVQ
ncbi:MAG: hypothetical protein Q8R12_05285 [bacterium]|nr:hypothetical protein [bacterium]